MAATEVGGAGARAGSAAATGTAPGAETELERAEKRYAQAKARLLALRNRAATQERKLDTRRKVILGGALVDLAARDDGAAKLLDRLVRNLPREQDRKAFVGWKPGDALPEDGAAGGATDGAVDGATSQANGPGATASTGSAAAPTVQPTWGT